MADTYTSATHLVGSTPGQITSSGRIDGLGAKGTVWIDKGQQADGSWLYWRKGYAGPVVTPAPDPVPASAWTLHGGELYGQSDAMLIGLNAYGTLGCSARGPADLPYSDGLARAGLTLLPSRIETILRGVAVDGFVIGWRGGRISNIPGTNLRDMLGTCDDDGTWRGLAGPIDMTQTTRLDGSTLYREATIMNIGTVPLVDLRFLYQTDFDTNGDKTANRDRDAWPVDGKIIARGTVQCGLRGEGKGRVVTMATDDPRAVATFYKAGRTVNVDPHDPALHEAAQPVGYARTADSLANLTWALGSVQPGETVRIAWTMGVA